MTESKGERIVREMSEEWSSTNGDGDEYALAIEGVDWREFWKELREKIDGEDTR